MPGTGWAWGRTPGAAALGRRLAARPGSARCLPGCRPALRAPQRPCKKGALFCQSYAVRTLAVFAATRHEPEMPCMIKTILWTASGRMQMH